MEPANAPKALSTHPFVRSRGGMAALTAYVTIAAITIIITRSYLAATGYPQVGGGRLHIAHALYGGALMALAGVGQAIFLGSRARVICVIIGGVGFGLFLDEVGKFVTKTNDYFYHPAADIMYISVAVVIIGGQAVRLMRKPTECEELANAAAVVADGIAGGLGESHRRGGEELIRAAELNGADPAVIGALRELLDACPQAPDRLAGTKRAVLRLIPGFVHWPIWTSIAGWALAAVSAETFLTSLFDVSWRPSELIFGLGSGGDDVVKLSDEFYLVLGLVTFLLAGFAMIARRVTWRRVPRPLWPLRFLLAVAVAFTIICSVIDFAQFGFEALLSLAVGLITIALISDEIAALRSSASLTARAETLRM